ncbi:acyltransferase family protein [Mycolicibacterium bacteremicum]|uniref:Acyltransferase n=1 Tax=Mycolicibacterium bacteremicum TaxID=564198 RepID=A0A1W9YZG5_MYCBA|nr:acyltransferase [Mycolicibacterium bacteremicum]MCV7435242.1 acyltransferase [Mycolicibacterium bacteremicum]ORA05456.1 acyltransferase [Mycolicibacterium bacteremicum]
MTDTNAARGDVPPPAAAAPDSAVESQVMASAPNRARIIGLDGIRGLGCLAVVVGHVALSYSPVTHDKAFLGVLGLALILFFVLSGFLLFLPYIRRLTKDRSTASMPDTKQYVLHRIFRVFPGYLVIFLLCNYVLQVAYVENSAIQPHGTDAGTGMITDPWELLANLTLTQTYIPDYVQTGISPSWSLTLEIAFYASLPLLGLMLFGLRRRTDVKPLVLACLAPVILLTVGVVGRLFAPLVFSATGADTVMMQNWGPTWAAVFMRSFLTNADLFAYGMFAAILFVAIEQGVISAPAARRINMACYPLLLVSFVGALVLAVAGTVFATAGIGFVSAVFIAIVVFPLARGRDSRIARFLDAKPFYFVGLISLSVYLWHYPVLLLLGRYDLAAGDSWGGMLRNVAVVAVVTIVLSTITYYAVERPGLDLVKRFRKR